MSSAIIHVGDQQVIPLASRLIVGIRLQGTIGFLDPRQPHIIKPRPYLSYLAETMRRLHCDVTLFVPTNPATDADLFQRFHARDFCVPFRYVHDQSTQYGTGSRRGNRVANIAANNYKAYLEQKAEEVNGTQGSLARVLFIDAEINYRFVNSQTLILDNYVPLTYRQQREMRKDRLYDPFGDHMTSAQERRYAAAIAQAAGKTTQHRAALHAQHLTAELEKIQASTDLLNAEQAMLQHGKNNSTTSASSASAREGRSQKADRAAAPQMEGITHAPAVQLEDFCLVALAEMIAEMSATDDITVAEYLRMEPLVEKVEVPNHGKANYLPPENCTDIDLLHWDDIKVMEKAAQEQAAGPAPVQETAEHTGFFQ